MLFLARLAVFILVLPKQSDANISGRAIGVFRSCSTGAHELRCSERITVHDLHCYCCSLCAKLCEKNAVRMQQG